MLDIIYDPLFSIYALVGCIIILLGQIIYLQIRMHRLLSGKDGKSLEDSIRTNTEKIERLNTFEKEAISYFENVEKRLGRSIQAVRTIRFNPFKGIGEGGNQSFSTAFVSEKGNGAVISSLYSRDRVSIFSKPLEKFGSTFELTEEEKSVIADSKDSLK